MKLMKKDRDEEKEIKEVVKRIGIEFKNISF